MEPCAKTVLGDAAPATVPGRPTRRARRRRRGPRPRPAGRASGARARADGRGADAGAAPPLGHPERQRRGAGLLRVRRQHAGAGRGRVPGQPGAAGGRGRPPARAAAARADLAGPRPRPAGLASRHPAARPHLAEGSTPERDRRPPRARAGAGRRCGGARGGRRRTPQQRGRRRGRAGGRDARCRCTARADAATRRLAGARRTHSLPGRHQPAARDLVARLDDHRARHPGGVPRLPADQRRAALADERAGERLQRLPERQHPPGRARPDDRLQRRDRLQGAAAAGLRGRAGADLPLLPPLPDPSPGPGRCDLHARVPDVLHRHALPGAPGDGVLLPRAAAPRCHRPARRRGSGRWSRCSGWASCSRTTPRPT